jgi:hypothetical protein
MSGYLKVSISIFAAFCIALVLLYYTFPASVQVRSFNESFSHVDLGSTEKEAVQILGEPNARESTFRLKQEKESEAAYTRAAASDAQHYLLWFRGIDVIYSIGIDNHGIVVIKESGGTW